MSLFRAIGAVIIGIFVSYVLAQQLEGVLVRSLADPGQQLTFTQYFALRNTPGVLAARLVVSLFTGVLGGYMAAQLAREDAIRTVAIAAAAMTMMMIWDFTGGEFAWGTPIWMRVALVLVSGPAMMVGAMVRARAAEVGSEEPPKETP
jgi:hypothetical protein